MYTIYDLSDSVTERTEALGSKAKIWLTPKSDTGLSATPHLFKIGRPGTGENWSEKVACELARLIGLPHAEYHFATLHGDEGVISEQFFPANALFLPANTLLAQIVDEYDDKKRFKQVKYQLSTALGILRRTIIQAPIGYSTIYPALSAVDFFVGYLIFDALIGNTDRHHENWGLVVSPAANDQTGIYLAPTFDHASSMGRNEPDEARQRRLLGKDRRDSVEAYADRAHSAFFGQRANRHTLTSRELVLELAQAYPTSAKFWAEKICALTLAERSEIFANIKSAWITTPAAEFAIKMLEHNRTMIQEIVIG